MKRSEMNPRVFLRMTDDWLELTMRFIAPGHGIRELKDALTRDILAALDAAGIGIAAAAGAAEQQELTASDEGRPAAHGWWHARGQDRWLERQPSREGGRRPAGAEEHRGRRLTRTRVSPTSYPRPRAGAILELSNHLDRCDDHVALLFDGWR